MSIDVSNRLKACCLLWLLLLWVGLFVPSRLFAVDVNTDVGRVQAPVAQQAQVDTAKLEVAKKLTAWLQSVLKEKQALVAVVARKGGEDVKKHDLTGMAHSGLAVYDPRAKTWLVYNLLYEQKGAEALNSLWKTAPLDFFYGQTGYEPDALLLIPEPEVQQRMYEAILNGNYKQLQFTQRYNLLSRYDSLDSLNCNKWLLLNIAAARSDNYNPAEVLKVIHQGFEPGLIRLNAIEKLVVKRKPNVRPEELRWHAPLETVTVESLYRSSLFQDRVFFSGKHL